MTNIAAATWRNNCFAFA